MAQVTGDELTRVTSLLSEQMRDGFGGVHDRLDKLEQEIRPQIKSHGEDLAVIKASRKTEGRRRIWVPTLSAGSVVTIIEAIRQVPWSKLFGGR